MLIRLPLVWGWSQCITIKSNPNDLFITVYYAVYYEGRKSDDTGNINL